jgi:hypothetical protein
VTPPMSVTSLVRSTPADQEIVAIGPMRDNYIFLLCGTGQIFDTSFM